MKTGMIKAFSATEIAWLEGKHISTIMKNRSKYIPVRIDNSISRTKERGFGIRYLRVSDLKKYQGRYL